MTTNASTPSRSLLNLRDHATTHMVGNGFPVRSIFDYETDRIETLSPFLLMDYIGPRKFDPTSETRGVGEHPHRGFETVTLAYQGEVEHRDSAGGSGLIRAGDVQWMTAGSGVMHEEMHSTAFTRQGGTFEAIQLWVNLPAKDKLTAPRYQSLEKTQIPAVARPDGGQVRVIAGDYQGIRGAARTFTPLTLLDVTLPAGAQTTFDLPERYNVSVFVRHGNLTFAGTDKTAGEAMLATFGNDGRTITVTVTAQAATGFLVMGGEPIREPIVGQGPFVMNTAEEIRTAYADLRHGRFVRLAGATATQTSTP